jgi:ubiquinone/menaquinone biosynthesis C-methylase UbiE
MPMPMLVLRQFSKPYGALASLFGWVLNRLNRDQNQATVAALELGPDHAALDIGFGGAVSLPMLLKACPQGKVAGIEISPEMVQRAHHAHAAAVASGQLELVEASVESLPWPDGTFHGAFAVNTVYFWPKLEEGVAEVLRVLRPGGRLILSNVPPEMLKNGGFPSVGGRAWAPEEYSELLARAGFTGIEIRPLNDQKGTTLIIARKP